MEVEEEGDVEEAVVLPVPFLFLVRSVFAGCDLACCPGKGAGRQSVSHEVPRPIQLPARRRTSIQSARAGERAARKMG